MHLSDIARCRLGRKPQTVKSAGKHQPNIPRKKFHHFHRISCRPGPDQAIPPIPARGSRRSDSETTLRKLQHHLQTHLGELPVQLQKRVFHVSVAPRPLCQGLRPHRHIQLLESPANQHFRGQFHVGSGSGVVAVGFSEVLGNEFDFHAARLSASDEVRHRSSSKFRTKWELK